MTPASAANPIAACRRLSAAVSVVVSLAVLAPTRGPAQAPPAADTAGAAQATAPRTGEQASPQPVFGLLRPEDGALEPLPAGTTYGDFLDWVAARRGPGYGIEAVSLSVRPADEARMEVKADIRLVIHRKGEWVRVPLAFDEAVLTAFEHEGPGVCSFSRKAGEAGLAWSFDGAGEHSLRLTLSVPVAAKSQESRLSLTTPADAALTSIDLALPLIAEVTAAGGLLRDPKIVDGRTEIGWAGAGGRIELAWRPKPVAADLNDLVAETTFIPRVNGKTVELQVRQKVTARRGQLSTLDVLLPAGYALVDVSGTLHRSHRETPGDGGRLVSVQLTEPTAGPFELKWTATAPLPENGPFTVSGFTLPGVPDASQTGRVLVEEAAGYRLRSEPAASQGVQPLAMVEPAELAVSAAFGVSQPFRLALSAERIPPEYSVSRKLLVGVTPDRLSVTGDLALSVAKGEVRELELLWSAPDMAVAPVRAGNAVEDRTAASPAKTKLRVTNPALPILIPVSATLTRDTTAAPAVLPLPRLKGAAPETVSYAETTLALRHDERLAVEAVPVGGGSLRPLGDAEAATLSLPDPRPGERWTVYKATNDVTEVSFAVRRLVRTVSAAVSVAVRPQGEGLLVEERIDYDIRHGAISELRAGLPAGVSGVRFTDASGNELPTSSPLPGRPKPDGPAAEVSIGLGRSVMGAFSLVAEYRTPAPTPDGTPAVVPVIRPSDAEIQSVRLRVAPPPNHRAAVEGGPWVPFQTTVNDGQNRWAAAELAEAVTVRFDPRRDAAPNGPVVSKLLLRTAIGSEGSAETVADCRFERAPRHLSLSFPEGAEPLQFSWRGQELQGRRLPQTRAVELDLGDEGDPGVLRVGFRSATGKPPGFAEAVKLPAFRFEGGIPVEQTLWQVSLAESQHLFTPPDGYTPRYSWGLSPYGLWVRRPYEPFGERLAEWFGGEVGRGPESPGGHRYAFSHRGAPEPLAFTVIARSLVVLIGAGAAIAVGYAFANGLIRRRRLTAAALIAAALALATLYPDQVHIFLQPAVFGLVLVTVAAVAERVLRKRQDRLAAMDAPPSGVDFVTILPGEGSTSAPQASIGSEEPTVLRPGRAAEPVGAHGRHPA